jgi:REP element-mobilizing transposase RayT
VPLVASVESTICACRSLGYVPRKPRLEVPNGFFHVAALGVDRSMIFRDPDDRLSFISLLNTAIVRSEWKCQSYCLMGTHFHLIVRTPKPTLSRGVQWLCGVYGQRFNKRHGRRGHLFGGRFMSIRITSERHLLAAHRYVALNPVRAGLCSNALDWRWNSCRSVLGRDPIFSFLDVTGLLALFDYRPAVARESFRRLIGHAQATDIADQYKLARTDGV